MGCMSWRPPRATLKLLLRTMATPISLLTMQCAAVITRLGDTRLPPHMWPYVSNAE